MAIKRGNNYFEIFVNLVDYSCAAAKKLHETLENFDLSALPKMMEYLHQIEHAADLENHDMMDKLAREFITPIEREDIIELAKAIDDVTDAIEDVMINIYMFDVRSIRKDALEFTSVIARCCEALKAALQEFSDFKKSAMIHSNIIEINRLEEVGDELYTRAMHTLYTQETNPIEVMRWTLTFEQLEKCCDSCEDAANIFESIIMKNS